MCGRMYPTLMLPAVTVTSHAREAAMKEVSPFSAAPKSIFTPNNTALDSPASSTNATQSAHSIYSCSKPSEANQLARTVVRLNLCQTEIQTWFLLRKA